jgi:hypothetical protein
MMYGVGFLRRLMLFLTAHRTCPHCCPDCGHTILLRSQTETDSGGYSSTFCPNCMWVVKYDVWQRSPDIIGAKNYPSKDVEGY